MSVLIQCGHPRSGVVATIEIQETEDARTVTEILTRNGYAINLRGANQKEQTDDHQ